MPVESELELAVRAAFGAEGPLARAEPHFRGRTGQTEMAVEVARTVAKGGVLVVEAGTGVGKTFAYLVPALLSGERVLLSTATKTLQDQLYARDLPGLAEALNLPVRTALLKGRSSYLCLHRLELARQDPGADGAGVRHTLARIESWAQATQTGDLAELVGLDERSPVIPLVTSTRENCLGSPCPQFRACHVNRARRDALAADIVVINHHLFFADLAIRESGMAELLPTVRVVVFDEAHQINEVGVQFFGLQLSSGQLLDLARDTLAAGLQFAQGLLDWTSLAARLDHAARDLRMAAGAAPSGGARLRWTGGAPEGVAAAAWAEALERCRDTCSDTLLALDTMTELAPDFERLRSRAARLAAHAETLAAPCPDSAVRWVDLGVQARLVQSPLAVGEAMQTRLLHRPVQGAEHNDHADVNGEPAGDGAHAEADPPESGWGENGAIQVDALPPSARPSVPPCSEAGLASQGDSASDRPRERAWVFTSATLGDDPELRWFTEPCGLLGTARILRVASPFDYATQAALYVPPDLPLPSAPHHAERLAATVGDAAQTLGGRTLVLTTTLKAMRTIGEALQRRFGSDSGIEVLVQGQWPKRRLMERFREGGAGQDQQLEGGDRRPGCILVASASFWEGVDVPGDALQLLVIDKLPFPPPNDPLVEARSRQLEAQGRSAFKDYALPEAAVALKQGAGRLIRRETDRGILLVGDTRLRSMGYGRRLLKALPPMRLLQTPEAFAEALDALLTRPSTTGPNPT